MKRTEKELIESLKLVAAHVRGKKSKGVVLVWKKGTKVASARKKSKVSAAERKHKEFLALQEAVSGTWKKKTPTVEYVRKLRAEWDR
jgi:hypothetical protein